jgi:hypothetical protein
VVLLDPAVGRIRRIRREIPNREVRKPCVYVGMTGLTPEERFANPKQGIKAAWAVTRYGIRLLPELYLKQDIAAGACRGVWQEWRRGRRQQGRAHVGAKHAQGVKGFGWNTRFGVVRDNEGIVFVARSASSASPLGLALAAGHDHGILLLLHEL